MGNCPEQFEELKLHKDEDNTEVVGTLEGG
jgi:hypothetical protein